MARKHSRVRHFLSELRRRKVIRVAIGYAIIGAGVTEAANNLLGPIGVSDFVQRGIAVLVLIGFPITLVLSWVFDLTPRGLERTPDIQQTGQSLATGGAAGSIPRVEKSLPPGSIGAIPFINLSGDASQDYLSDGLTEELLTALSRVPGLRVAARTSCFAVRDSKQDIRELGHRLGVRNIVEGSVRLAGRTLRLSVRLVEVESGYALWTETYDREIDDIFDVQSEIASAIAERLTQDAHPVAAGAVGGAVAAAVAEPASGSGAAEKVAGPGTQNVVAFQHYLRGRFHWNRRTEADLRTAIEEFGRAAQVDPQYAAAFAGLADAYSLLLDYGGIPPDDGLGPARDAVERALELDPDLAEAYTSLALVREFEWRWTDAERAFRRSIELQPDYAIAHQRFALHLAWRRRDDEAIHETRRAEELDPLSVAVGASAGFVLYYARQYAEAVTQLERTIEADPTFATAHVALGLALLQLGQADRAVEHLEVASRQSSRASSVLGGLACALAVKGDSTAAAAIVAELEASAEAGWVSGYHLAVARLGLGDRDGALDRLEMACDERVPQMAYLAREPLLDPLRDSPRFTALLERVGLSTA